MVERGRALLRPEADGTLTLWHSWTEMGQGVHTVALQVAAGELMVSPRLSISRWLIDDWLATR